MSSDINECYRRVIYQNNTITDLLITFRSTPEEKVMYEDKLVQEAKHTLLDNQIHRQPMRDGDNKVYKSFLDVIEGNEGTFRSFGKLVDYSDRFIIVVRPSLSLHRCGLPRAIAIEHFQTFVIRDNMTNIGVAKSQIRENEPVVWKRLIEVMQGHPVLLNSAPTLHRLGIQAFQPEGLRFAQAEARLLMFSHMNLLSPSIGDPISIPTQDMLIGLYVLMSGNRRGIRANRSNPWNHKN
ncbi:hypothetical protein Cgig2_002576 [Carnegiea gigantea]|uniref:DNA-directed RNA polymerase n=1 Tax=Carnegiea gigantea TaxID=171969 RepID=A0A9Q1JEU6_9CARY|nr:hypothetical protein Cgig2_002576 [Carnegiea gigantea]